MHLHLLCRRKERTNVGDIFLVTLYQCWWHFPLVKLFLGMFCLIDGNLHYILLPLGFFNHLEWIYMAFFYSRPFCSHTTKLSASGTLLSNCKGVHQPDNLIQTASTQPEKIIQRGKNCISVSYINNPTSSGWVRGWESHKPYNPIGVEGKPMHGTPSALITI